MAVRKTIEVILCDMCNKDVTKLNDFEALTGGCRFLIAGKEFDLCEECQITLRKAEKFFYVKADIKGIDFERKTKKLPIGYYNV